MVKTPKNAEIIPDILKVKILNESPVGEQNGITQYIAAGAKDRKSLVNKQWTDYYYRQIMFRIIRKETQEALSLEEREKLLKLLLEKGFDLRLSESIDAAAPNEVQKLHKILSKGKYQLEVKQQKDIKYEPCSTEIIERMENEPNQDVLEIVSFHRNGALWKVKKELNATSKDAKKFGMYGMSVARNQDPETSKCMTMDQFKERFKVMERITQKTSTELYNEWVEQGQQIDLAEVNAGCLRFDGIKSAGQKFDNYEIETFYPFAGTPGEKKGDQIVLLKCTYPKSPSTFHNRNGKGDFANSNFRQLCFSTKTPKS